MAEIKAFRGMRYNTEKAGEISQLCCPPYDIISEEQRLGYIRVKTSIISFGLSFRKRAKTRIRQQEKSLICGGTGVFL